MSIFYKGIMVGYMNVNNVGYVNICYENLINHLDLVPIKSYVKGM